MSDPMINYDAEAVKVFVPESEILSWDEALKLATERSKIAADELRFSALNLEQAAKVAATN
jgi:hypothetical protein